MGRFKTNHTTDSWQPDQFNKHIVQNIYKGKHKWRRSGGSRWVCMGWNFIGHTHSGWRFYLIGGKLYERAWNMRPGKDGAVRHVYTLTQDQLSTLLEAIVFNQQDKEGEE